MGRIASVLALALLLPARCLAADCDVNGDSKVLTSDALVVLRAAVGQPSAMETCGLTQPTGDRYFQRNFVGFDGSGTITLDARPANQMIFSIAVTSGDEFFCLSPDAILQDANQWGFSTSGTGNTFKITWSNFDGCGDIYAGITATGTITGFPAGFDYDAAFRFIPDVWETDDYFDVGAR